MSRVFFFNKCRIYFHNKLHFHLPLGKRENEAYSASVLVGGGGFGQIVHCSEGFRPLEPFQLFPEKALMVVQEVLRGGRSGTLVVNDTVHDFPGDKARKVKLCDVTRVCVLSTYCGRKLAFSGEKPVIEGGGGIAEGAGRSVADGESICQPEVLKLAD